MNSKIFVFFSLLVATCFGFENCDEHRESVLNRGQLVGAYLPQCCGTDYCPVQCHGSTGYCWCANTKTGEQLGDQVRGKPNCLTPASNDASYDDHVTCDAHLEDIMSKGPLIGAFVPSCCDNGAYCPRQCSGSTGYCWCVDARGNEVSEPKRPWEEEVNCDTPCVQERIEGYERAHTMVGFTLPNCCGGDYCPKQCSGSTGYCWCADPKTGERVSEQVRGEPNCLTAASFGYATCKDHFSDVMNGGPLVGAFIPHCCGTGQIEYCPMQCHGSTGYCWCSDKDGNQVGDKIRGKPNC